MPRALFLGNSHIAAYKLGHEQLASSLPYDCEFFCARGADLAFTTVEDGVLKPTTNAAISSQQLRFFFTELGPRGLERYVVNSEPLADVAQQFHSTGGSSEIDLRAFDAVFYTAGVSPYDFARLQEPAARRTAALRRALLDQMLDREHVLRRQILAARVQVPGLRHYLIGAPLQFFGGLRPTEQQLEIIYDNRRLTAMWARDYLFDDVFMPATDVLNLDMITTQELFFQKGKAAAEAYQGVAASGSDHLHVNAEYAKIVFREFVTPNVMNC